MNKFDKDVWRLILKSSGISQNKAARLVGMSTVSLSRKVLGKREFTVTEMIKLSLLLKIDDPLVIFAPELLGDGAEQRRKDLANKSFEKLFLKGELENVN